MSEQQTAAINSAENVVRAIFSPAMIDNAGNISKAAFSLRHNEDYISVARISIEGWLNDIKSIPVSGNRKLVGYGKMKVCDIKSLDVPFFRKPIVFDVEAKATKKNQSHAGITITYDGEQLRGDKVSFLKPVQEMYPTSMLMLKIQTNLANLANQNFIKIQNTLAD